MAGKRGTSVPTIYDVARECGVAPSTVSRALSQPGRGSAATRQRILSAAARLGYRPNPLARSLHSGRTETIGLVVGDIPDAVRLPIILGAEAEATAAGHTLTMTDVARAPAGDEHAVVERLAQRVDGVALAAPRLPDIAIRALAAEGPVVAVNRVVPQVPSVVTDDGLGMRRVAAHLADLGHAGVIYLAGPSASWANAVRWQALRAAGEQLGLTVRRIGPYAPTVSGGWAAAADLITWGAPAEPEDAEERPWALPRTPVIKTATTAIVACNDLVAIGAMQGLSDLGVEVPAEVSVVGCDNVVGSDWCAPALTTLAAPLREIGAAAVRYLLTAASGEASAPPHRRPLILPPRLIVRESTAAPRISG